MGLDGCFATVCELGIINGKFVYTVKYPDDSAGYQYEQFFRAELIADGDVLTPEYYAAFLTEKWWADDDPRRFMFGGIRFVCWLNVFTGYWSISKADGKGLQEGLTLEELAELLAQMKAEEKQ